LAGSEISGGMSRVRSIGKKSLGLRNCAGGGYSGRDVWGIARPMQDYKSLRVAVVICASLVNTQTHTRRERVSELEWAFDRALLSAQPVRL